MNLIIKGFIYGLSILIAAFLFFVLLEHQLYTPPAVRILLFFGYLALCAIVFYKWIGRYFIKLIWKSRQLSDEEAAKQIGGFFPQVQDRLLNLLQLQRLHQSDALIYASIAQKANNVGNINFRQAIDISRNKRYLKYLLLPLLALLVLSAFSPEAILAPSQRIVQFNKQFAPEAPFQFIVDTEQLLAYKNEDFSLALAVEGNTLPENVYLVVGDRRYKTRAESANEFNYLFKNLQHNTEFHLEAAGYRSTSHTINVVSRPNIKNFQVSLTYPSYLNRSSERLDNVGNLDVPEGTEITWTFQTLAADDLWIHFDTQDTTFLAQQSDNQSFTVKNHLFSHTDYTVGLKNPYGSNKNLIQYTIDVQPDEYPAISLQQFKDTVLFDLVVLGGNISDDHGLYDLQLFYRSISSSQAEAPYISTSIGIDRSKLQQSFYHSWDLKKLNLHKGETIEYYLQVRDNDALHGRKASRTATYRFQVPDRQAIKESIAASSQKTERQMNKSLEKAKDLKQNLDELENKLKGKHELNWQDQKQLEHLLEQKQALDEALKELSEQLENENEKRSRFDEEQSERMKEKVERLQQLMDELLDEETKKLYEELQKLLEENKDLNEIKDLLKQMNRKEQSLENEIDRALELYKRMKFDFELEQTIDDIKETQKEQEQQSEKSKDKEQTSEQLSEQQQRVNEKFEKDTRQIRKLEELNQELKNPNASPDTKEDEDQIKEDQKEAEEQLDRNNRKKASDAQQKAAEKMNALAQKLEQMQMNAESMAMEMNMSQLRDILDHLVKLSFSQEALMNEFKEVNQSDPRFLQLSEKQLDLRDDAAVIQDSLLSLAKGNFMIQSFVTREVDQMNQYLGETLEAIKERKKGEAVGKQQYAMTSINNLALMLDDVMTQMMQAMNGMGSPKKGQPSPSMSELQQQLSEQIQNLKKSGQQGRELSEQLAKMAAEQERLRQMLQQLEEQLQDGQGENGSGKLEEIRKQMEQSEIDLVNKQLTDQLIKRQREIVTRLLQAEKSARERELDEEREGDRPTDYQRNIPKAFEEYIKLKEREIELLKTVPPKLNPYYKKEVTEYFKRIGS